jgi:hypothetical protein
MSANDYSVTPPPPLSGAVPARKSDNDLAGPSARRQAGKRRPSRHPGRASGASASAAPGTDSAGAKRTPPGEDGELHVDCFI